jgi:hypothetical protein
MGSRICERGQRFNEKHAGRTRGTERSHENMTGGDREQVNAKVKVGWKSLCMQKTIKGRRGIRKEYKGSSRRG